MKDIPLIKEIMQAIALEYQWPEVLPKEKKVIELADTTGYTGTYITQTGLQFDVTSNRGRITIQFAQQSPLAFFPLSDSILSKINKIRIIILFRNILFGRLK
jgi:hypothetical protein